VSNTGGGGTGGAATAKTTAKSKMPRSERLPLRGRLALLAAAAVALSVMAAAYVSYHLVDSELNNQLNQNLVTAAATAPLAQPAAGLLSGGGQSGSGQSGVSTSPTTTGQACVTTPNPLPLGGAGAESGQSTGAGTGTEGGGPSSEPGPGGLAFHGGGSQYITQTVEPNGTVCLPTYPFDNSTYTLSSYTVASTATDRAVAAGTAQAYFRDAVTSTGIKVRVYTTQARGQQLAVQTIADVSGLNSAMSSLAWKLGLVALIGIFLAVLAGLLVARSALVPVRRLTRVAEHVGRTGDLSVRLPAAGRDEVGRLGRAFNKMAAALALSRDRQQRLIADAGHELRTPLTSLRTNVDLLLRSERTGRALPDGRRESMLESVDQQLHELSGLVTDLLELSRSAEGGGRRPTMRVALHEAVDRAVQRARLRGPGLAFDVEVEPWYVQGDPTGLDRAVVNLLDNAVKFSPPGGVVTVRLQQGEYSVTDQGPGIAPEDLPKVFERFYRSDSARSLPGSGLGLAIVAHVAMESGGTIALEPANAAGPGTGTGADTGTVARLRLPGSA
jgi:two-component system, OmpR family, sensor histidine kinase MprB